jgi:DNA-binding LacI/PurR family transcriptional regulator
MTRKKTIHDVAEMAGVCIGTVSRVINNKDKVHPETRRRILDLIEQTGYRPSALGRGLVLRRTCNIMLQVPNVSDPYSASVAKNVSNYCRGNGYRTLLGDSDYDPAIEAEYLRRARDGSADGLLISPLPTDENIPCFLDLVHAGFPLVAMDNAIPGVPISCVKYDDLAGAIMAVDYLFEKGHRNIAYLQWRPEYQTVKDRLQGYTFSHAKRGLAVNPDYIVLVPESLQSWSMEPLDRLLRMPDPPTAIFAENEIMAMACVSTLGRLGKRIPEDVAVMSFGDALLDHVTPVPLTTIWLHQDETSRKAVQLLLELIEDPQRRCDPPQQHVQKPELIIRKSA